MTATASDTAALDRLARAIAAHVRTLFAMPARGDDYGPGPIDRVVPAAELDGLARAFTATLAGHIVDRCEQIAEDRGYEPYAPIADGDDLCRRMEALVDRREAWMAYRGWDALQAARELAGAAALATGAAVDRKRADLIGAASDDMSSDYRMPRAADPRIFMASWASSIMSAAAA